jgi:Fe-S cluster biogenesis protein NfuA
LDTVNRIVEEKINPVLAVDRGSVEVVEVRQDEGVVVLRYRGRCAGCPAAPITHKKIVTGALVSADRSIRKVEYTLFGGDDG